MTHRLTVTLKLVKAFSLCLSLTPRTTTTAVQCTGQWQTWWWDWCLKTTHTHTHTPSPPHYSVCAGCSHCPWVTLSLSLTALHNRIKRSAVTLTSLLVLTGTCSFAPKKENSLKERGIVWLEGWRGGVWRGVREVQRGGEGGGGGGRQFHFKHWNASDNWEAPRLTVGLKIAKQTQGSVPRIQVYHCFYQHQSPLGSSRRYCKQAKSTCAAEFYACLNRVYNSTIQSFIHQN